MKQNQINILDCTLRDGGYVNDWNFSNKDIKKTIKKLVNANIEIVECGFLDTNKGKNNNSTRFESYEVLEKLISDIKLSGNQLLVAMVDLNSYDLSTLPNITNNSKIKGIRLVFRRTNYNEAIDQAKLLKQKGFKVFMQPMSTVSFSNEELKSFLEKINNLNPYAVYIVDTVGSMYQDTFLNLYSEVEKTLNNDIKLGFHSHNNLQLSYAIAIDFINSVKNREIIIDSSIYGMGRGAGNLNTELLADFLNKKYSKNYEIENILELIDSYFYALYKANQWGYSLAHFLSASYSVHPNYASYLLDTKRLSINEIKTILSLIPNKNVYEYSKTLIEELYFMHNSSKQKLVKEPSFDSNRKILLLGSGQNIKSKIKEIKEKRDEYLIISLNHKPDFLTPDFYFFNSQKRYDEFIDTIEKYNIISSSNLEVNTNYTLNYKDLSTINDSFQNDVSVVMMMNYFKNKSLKNIYLAGIDGFKIDAGNYSYEEDDKLVDETSINELNNSIKKAIEILSKDIKIEFITETIFKIYEKPKILGVIPARYKSSRFEGKPLCLINGIPMIKRTYLQAKQSNLLDGLVVATEDERIKQYCEIENIPVIMTSDNCLTGTDRLAEVSKSLNYDLYVNIQGDEPVIDPKSIEEIINEYLKYEEEFIAYNLYKMITDISEVNTDTIIKVITNEKDELMYMSRLGVPFNKSNFEVKYKKQICVYGFTKQALDVFSSRTKTLNEQYEDIEILRFVDMGYKVKMKETTVDSIAVDVPSDVKKVENFLEKKGLV
ncbi:MAG: 3-deoxy-manno-octulosonate cytidylyltransferase [Aliarcobacter sp.]|jgi:3-deoxy-D-manno-octulosonate cytidylyltransferase|nr:3-deoxy-manno-octulosonate cytidylyltransferase [Aliarcobacter sp.]